MREQVELDLERYPLSMSEFDWKIVRASDLDEERPELSAQERGQLMGRELLARWDAEFERRQSSKRKAGQGSTDRQRRVEARRNVPLEHHIGRRIAAERVYGRRRQVELARAIGVTRSSMSDIERGRRPATAAELVLIADELGCPLEAFVAGRSSR